MNAKSESIPEELKMLLDNRALILLVELMGFLHDVGKLSSDLYEKHYNRYDKDVENKFIPSSLQEIFDKDLENLLKDILPKESIEKLRGVKIKGFQRHHTRERRHKDREYRPTNWIEEIINLADDKDSSEDRGKAIAKQEKGKEFKASVFGKEEPLKKEEFEKERKKFYESLVNLFLKLLDFDSQGKIIGIKKNTDLKEFHREMVKAIEVFKAGVAVTDRSSNDVTLYDHSYMVGSVAKALVGKTLLDEDAQKRFAQQIIRRKAEEDLENPGLTSREKEINKKILEEIKPLEHFDEECNLDLLIVSFDGFGFISGGVNLLDVGGRKIVIEKIKESVKNLLEVEYPIGNCIYEDENNLCFLTFPLEDESFNYLKKEVYKIFNEKTFGILVPIIDRRQNLQYYGEKLKELKEESEKSIRGGLIKDFEPKWIEKWKNVKGREKCVVCGKLPQWKGKDSDYLCEYCWTLRYKVEKEVEMEDSDSPWIDEITDENGRIAVVVGAFHPINKWLSGEFLNYQKIRTEKDLRNFVNGEINFKEATKKFIECFPTEMKKRKDFVELLRSLIGSLDEKFKREWTILGGGSKVGELYYRLSEESQRLLKEQSRLSEEQIDKIAQEIVKVTTTKPPSPSRLHRIWRELEEFSRSRIEEVRRKMSKGKRLKFGLKEFEGETGIYTAIIPEIGRIEVFYDKGNREFMTIERIDINDLSDESKRINDDEFLVKHLDLENKLKERLKNNKIEIYKDKTKEGFDVDNINFEDYIRFREILASPNGFLFILPQNEAIRTLVSIRNEFKKFFSKILGNISLNIGIVSSYRKFPIYIVLDSARKMISVFNTFDFEEVKVEDRKDSLIKLKVENKKVEMDISDKLGDGNEDLYYPYLLTPDESTKHIKDIEKGEKLKVILSHFDFEFLDSSQRRFDIILDKNKRRKHSVIGEYGPRPYLLEDLKDIIYIWDIMNKELTHSQIKNLEYLCSLKIEEWELKNIIGKNTLSKEEEEKLKKFEEFVRSSLENICEELSKDRKERIRKSIMSGMFFDVIELFMRLEVKSPSPFDAISLYLGDFQYTKEERRKAEKWLSNQIRKGLDWKNYLEGNRNASR